MRIKINTELREELEWLNNWIKNPDKPWAQEGWVQDSQEQILQVLALISNPKFRKRIQSLREKYKVPNKWYRTPDMEDEAIEELPDFLDKNPKAPTNSYDKVILKLCEEFNVDFKMYGDFLIDYLYFRHVRFVQSPAYEWFEHLYSEDAYRYKTKIEIEVEEKDKSKPEYTPKAAYIRFYGDTTMTQLISFIEANRLKIAKLQKLLKPYPHKRKFEKFKRDIQIYLLSQLDLSTNEIAEEITSADKESIDETGVRQAVKIISDKIKEINNF